MEKCGEVESATWRAWRALGGGTMSRELTRASGRGRFGFRLCRSGFADSEVQGKKMGVTVFYKSCWGRTYAHCCAQEASGYAVTKGILSLVSKQ